MEFVHALCPQQAIDRKTPIAWHAVLGKLDFHAAQAAVISLKHSQKFIDPSDIVTQAQRSADSHPSSRPVAEAIAAANYPELDPADATPPTREFLTAKASMLERMRDRDERAYLAGREVEQRAQAWIDYKLSGKLPPQLPLLAEPAGQWTPLPGDLPELRAWLARKAA